MKKVYPKKEPWLTFILFYFIALMIAFMVSFGGVFK